MFRPAAVYRELTHREGGRALMLRKPLLLAFAIGCLISALASGRLSARLITDGSVSFAFVPLIQMTALAVVSWTGTRERIPFARAVDLFFVGNAPWLLWIGVVTALSCVVLPRQIGPWLLPVLAASLIPAAWSAYIEYHFFREVMNRPAGSAVRDLLLQRVIGWVAAAVYFFGIAIWSETLPELAAWMGL